MQLRLAELAFGKLDASRTCFRWQTIGESPGGTTRLRTRPNSRKDVTVVLVGLRQTETIRTRTKGKYWLRIQSALVLPGAGL